MLTLAINTATQNESVALLNNNALLGEITWRSNKDESKKLLPNIKKILRRSGYKLHDLKKIIVVNGPGPYAALRIGVTVANTLAFALGAQLATISTVDFMRVRLPKNYRNAQLWLNAGGLFISDGRKITKIEAVLTKAKGAIIFGDLTEEQKNSWIDAGAKFIEEKYLNSFGEIIAANAKTQSTKIALPSYWRAPLITKPHAQHRRHTDRKS